jgi:hypothetical protein
LGLFVGGAENADTVGAGFFFVEDLGFFASRLDFCCPLLTVVLLKKIGPTRCLA